MDEEFHSPFERGEWRSYHFWDLRTRNDNQITLIESESSRIRRVRENKAGIETFEERGLPLL